MTSKTVAQLIADLEVTRSHSRPKVSNDNPYSEAWFKTLKYAPTFPDRFGSLADAQQFMDAFVEGSRYVGDPGVSGGVARRGGGPSAQEACGGVCPVSGPKPWTFRRAGHFRGAPAA
jgi:transposase InsO family protein